jgi:hypothetical protein
MLENRAGVCAKQAHFRQGSTIDPEHKKVPGLPRKPSIGRPRHGKNLAQGVNDCSNEGERTKNFGNSAKDLPDRLETFPNRMRVPRKHRLDTMAGNLGQVGVVDAGGAEVGDVGVAALVGADV